MKKENTKREWMKFNAVELTILVLVALLAFDAFLRNPANTIGMVTLGEEQKSVEKLENGTLVEDSLKTETPAETNNTAEEVHLELLTPENTTKETATQQPSS